MLSVFKFLCTSVRVFEWPLRVLGMPYRPTPPPKRTDEDTEDGGWGFSFRNLPGRHLQISKEAVSQNKAFCTSIFLGVLMFYLPFITSLLNFLSFFLFFKYFEYDLDILVFIKQPKRVWWRVDVLLLLSFYFIWFQFLASSLSTINGVKLYNPVILWKYHV